MSEVDMPTVDEQVRAMIEQFAEIGRNLPADPAEFSEFDRVLYRIAEYRWHYEATGSLPGPTGAYSADDIEAALNILGDAYVEITGGNQ